MSRSFSRCLLNPFEYISSGKLLLIGLLLYLISSWSIFLSFNHFQGLISVKSGANSSLLWSFYNNGVSIVSLSFFTYFYGRLRNPKTRFIDVLNVVLISRCIIYFIALLINEPFFVKKALIKVELAILDNDFMLNTLATSDKVALVSLGLLSVLSLFYYFYFYISGIRFVINSKTKLDVLWLLLIFFGLEIAFTLFHVNIY